MALFLFKGGLSSGFILSELSLLMYSFVLLGAGLFLNDGVLLSGTSSSNNFAPVILLWPFASISNNFLTPFFLKELLVILNAPAAKAEPKAVPKPKPAAEATAPLL